QGVALGREHRLLTVDEKVALAPGGQNHALPLERALAQQVDQALLLVGRHLAFFLTAALAPFRNAGTTGGGGASLSTELGAPSSLLGGSDEGGGSASATGAFDDGATAGSVGVAGAGAGVGAGAGAGAAATLRSTGAGAGLATGTTRVTGR